MSVAIRIDDKLYEQAQLYAAAESRTAPLQVMYWAKVGKAALDNPDLPIQFVCELLAAYERREASEPFIFE